MMSKLIRDVVTAVDGVDLTKCSASYLEQLLEVVGREYVAEREMKKQSFADVNYEPTDIPHEEELSS